MNTAIRVVMEAMSFAADLVTILGALDAPPGVLGVLVVGATCVLAYLKRRDGGGGASQVAAAPCWASRSLRKNFCVEIDGLLKVSNETQRDWRR